MLTGMLKKHPTFQNLPEEDRLILARLATEFEKSSDNLFKSPEELTESTGIGNRFQWATLLVLEPTQSYIKAQMAQLVQIAQRKAFQSLQQMAKTGNVQAAREINELSGIMAQEETNKVIILHQISRPSIQPQKEAGTDEIQGLGSAER